MISSTLSALWKPQFFMSQRVVPGLQPELAAPPEIRFAPATHGSSAGETDQSVPPIPDHDPSAGRHRNANRQTIKSHDDQKQTRQSILSQFSE